MIKIFIIQFLLIVASLFGGCKMKEPDGRLI